MYEIWDKAYRSIIYCYSKVAFLSCNLPGGEVRQPVKQGMTGKSISIINFSIFHIQSLRNHKNLLIYSYFVDD